MDTNSTHTQALTHTVHAPGAEPRTETFQHTGPGAACPHCVDQRADFPADAPAAGDSADSPKAKPWFEG